jgi:Ala-tRNA(Pro) deacylase
MSAEHRADVEAYLRDQGVTFELIEHPYSETAAAEAQVARLPAEQTAKTVLLHTSEGYRLAVIPASDRLDEEMASDFPAYEVGAMPPVGPDTPTELIDMRLLAFGRVLCAGDHKHSLLVDPAEIVRVTEARTVDLRQD